MQEKMIIPAFQAGNDGIHLSLIIATPEREKVLALEDLLQNETRETNSLKQQLLDEKRNPSNIFFSGQQQ